MHEIGAFELCDLDALDGTFVHSEEDYAWQCCLPFDTECTKEMRVECFNGGSRSGVQVEDAQLRPSEAI